MDGMACMLTSAMWCLVSRVYSHIKVNTQNESYDEVSDFLFLVRFHITYDIDNDAVIHLIKEYNVKNTHTKFDMKLWSRSEAINVLAYSL